MRKCAVAALAWVMLLSQSCKTKGGAPAGVEIEAASDTTVRVTWKIPVEGVPDRYRVEFKSTGSRGYQQVGSASDTMFVHLPPGGATGMYRVVAVFGGEEFESVETASTVPAMTEGDTVTELNAGGRSGYGWDRTEGMGMPYSMGDASSAAGVDFYLTDWCEGLVGPYYYVASPDTAPDDPGNTGVVPPNSWRKSGFSNPLTGGHGAPRYEPGVSYFEIAELEAGSTYVACRTEDGYYALLRLAVVGESSGVTEVTSWFQKVRGLRLVTNGRSADKD